MKYVFTESEKRKQQNVIYQLWRFAVLSFKFTRLTRLGRTYPNRAKQMPYSKKTSITKHPPQESHS